MAEGAAFFYMLHQMVVQMFTKETDEPYVIKELLNNSPPMIFGGSKQRRTELKNIHYPSRNGRVVVRVGRKGNRNHSDLAYKPHWG